MKKIAIFLFVVSAIAGCQKDGGSAEAKRTIPGEELPALTEAQSQRMGNFNDELSDVQSANGKHVKLTDKNQGQGTHPLIRMAAAVVNNNSEFGQDFDKHFDPFSGNCVVQSEGLDEIPQIVNKVEQMMNSKSAEPTQLINAKIGVQSQKGAMEQCPVHSEMAMTLSGKGNVSGNAGSAELNIGFVQNFEIDPASELFQQTQVYGVYQSANANIKISSNGQTMAFSLNGTGESTFDIQQDLEKSVSLKIDMKFAGTASENAGAVNGVMALTYDFADFKAVGAIFMSMPLNSDQGAKMEYFINGDSVTEEEFIKFFSGTTDTLNQQMGGVSLQ